MPMQSRSDPLQEKRPVLKSSNFLTITGKMILTRRDFDLKSSEIHQEIGKSKAKAMVDELGLAEGIQTQKNAFL